MVAGSLDRRVTWQTATVTKDGTGNDVKTWATSFETWCGKLNLSGAEFIQAGENVDEQTVKIELRDRAGLSPVDRFIFEGKTWRIHAITESPTRPELLWVIGRTRADGLPVSG